MNNPIAVFDAGLGSYAIVEAIKSLSSARYNLFC